MFYGRRLSPALVVLAGTLLAAALLGTGSLALRLGETGGALGAVGGFLFDSFSWAAFFVPLYLFAGAWLLLAHVFRRRSALLLMFSILPFLTTSILLHVLAGTGSVLPQALVRSFGVVPAALLLILLLALEMAFILTLPRRGPRGSEPARREKRPLALPVVPVAEAEVPAAAEVSEPPRATQEAQPLPATENSGVVEFIDLIPPVADEPELAVEPAAPAAEAAAAPAPRARPPAPPTMETPRPEQEELPFPKGSLGAKAYGIPVHHVLKNRGDNEYWIIDDETKRASVILTNALKEFNIDAEVTGIRKGPVITLFEVLPAPASASPGSPTSPTTSRCAWPPRASASWRRSPAATRWASRCPTGCAPSSPSRR